MPIFVIKSVIYIKIVNYMYCFFLNLIYNSTCFYLYKALPSSYKWHNIILSKFIQKLSAISQNTIYPYNIKNIVYCKITSYIMPYRALCKYICQQASHLLFFHIFKAIVCWWFMQATSKFPVVCLEFHRVCSICIAFVLERNERACIS